MLEYHLVIDGAGRRSGWFHLTWIDCSVHGRAGPYFYGIVIRYSVFYAENRLLEETSARRAARRVLEVKKAIRLNR